MSFYFFIVLEIIPNTLLINVALVNTFTTGFIAVLRRVVVFVRCLD